MDASSAPPAGPAAPPFSGVIMMTPVHQESMDPRDDTICDLLVDNLLVNAAVLCGLPGRSDEHPTPTQQLAVTKKKCNVKGCPSFAPIVLLKSCLCEECDKLVHPICYKKLIAKAKENHNQINNKQFCMIKCQDLFLTETKTSGYTWTNDGQNGKTDPLHSKNVLLTWLNTGENFSKWSHPEGSKTILAVAADLVCLLKSKGCHANRSPTEVQAKICHIEGLMCQAYNFMHSETRE